MPTYSVGPFGTTTHYTAAEHSAAFDTGNSGVKDPPWTAEKHAEWDRCLREQDEKIKNAGSTAFFWFTVWASCVAIMINCC
jgi:hypothetical protein